MCLMQRSKGFGHGVVVPKICHNAVIVLSVVLSDCCKPMNNCRDWAFSNSGLEVGCQPFSCRCSLNVTQWETRFVGHGCFRNPFLPFPFWNSKHPLPTRRRFLRAAVSSTCLALWLHHAHPFVAAAGKNLSHRDKLQYSDCALSCAMRLLQTNEHLSRLSF